MDKVDLKSIDKTGWNPREHYDKAALQELADSIKAHGILEPLIVREGKKKGRYDLIAGERRLRATILAGEKEVPVVIQDMDDKTAREIMLLENLQREDLRPLEEARAIKMLLEDGSKQDDLAKRIGKSQSWISNRVRVLDGPDNVSITGQSHKVTRGPRGPYKKGKLPRGDVTEHAGQLTQTQVAKMLEVTSATISIHSSVYHIGTKTAGHRFYTEKDIEKLRSHIKSKKQPAGTKASESEKTATIPPAATEPAATSHPPTIEPTADSTDPTKAQILLHLREYAHIRQSVGQMAERFGCIPALVRCLCEELAEEGKASYGGQDVYFSRDPLTAEELGQMTRQRMKASA